MKYLLEVTEEQAVMVQKALELYMRLRLGQFGEIPWITLDLRDPDFRDKADMMEKFLLQARQIAYPELALSLANSYGVGKFKDADRAFMLYMAVRHRVTWTRQPEGGWENCFDAPYSMNGEDVPKCTVVKEDENAQCD